MNISVLDISIIPGPSRACALHLFLFSFLFRNGQKLEPSQGWGLGLEEEGRRVQLVQELLEREEGEASRAQGVSAAAGAQAMWGPQPDSETPQHWETGNLRS